MIITPQLQTQFNIAFSKIMSKTDASLQAMWNGKIEWRDMKSFPYIQHEVIEGMPPGAKAAYVTLLNKLSRGII